MAGKKKKKSIMAAVWSVDCERIGDEPRSHCVYSG